MKITPKLQLPHTYCINGKWPPPECQSVLVPSWSPWAPRSCIIYKTAPIGPALYSTPPPPPPPLLLFLWRPPNQSHMCVTPPGLPQNTLEPGGELITVGPVFLFLMWTFYLASLKLRSLPRGRGQDVVFWLDFQCAAHSPWAWRRQSRDLNRRCSVHSAPLPWRNLWHYFSWNKFDESYFSDWELPSWNVWSNKMGRWSMWLWYDVGCGFGFCWALGFDCVG